MIALCVFLVESGTYLGRSWLIGALAGIAASVALTPIAMIRSVRTPWDPLQVVWVRVSLLSMVSVGLPFSARRYGRPWAVVNVVHAVMLGYLTATMTALEIVLVVAFAHIVRANGWRALPYAPEPPLPRRPRRAGPAGPDDYRWQDTLS